MRANRAPQRPKTKSVVRWIVIGILIAFSALAFGGLLFFRRMSTPGESAQATAESLLRLLNERDFVKAAAMATRPKKPTPAPALLELYWDECTSRAPVKSWALQAWSNTAGAATGTSFTRLSYALDTGTGSPMIANILIDTDGPTPLFSSFKCNLSAEAELRWQEAAKKAQPQ